MGFDPKDIEAQLYEGEGSRLDFKKEHYAILNNSPKGSDGVIKKGEFLKDIVAFSNSPDDAYIIIGVDKDQKDENGRVKVLGDPLPNLDEADIQSVVNDNTNAPVTFEYDTVNVTGGTVAVFRIPKQARPIFLKDDIGKARVHTCYRRQGSRTVTISPDELIEWGRAEALASKRPAATVELGVDLAEVHGSTLQVTSILLSRDVLPSLEVQEALLKARRHYDDVFTPTWRRPSPEVHALVTQRERLAVVQFRVENTGSVTLEHTRLTLSIPRQEGLEVTDEEGYPSNPMSGRIHIPTAYVGVRMTLDGWQVKANIGQVLPHDHKWSDKFYVGATTSQTITAHVRMVAADLSPPIETALNIVIDCVPGSLDEAVFEHLQQDD